MRESVEKRAKTATIRAQIAPELKREVDAIFGALDLTATEAIALFYRQVEHCRGLPFDARIPKKETSRAAADIKSRRDLTRFEDARAFAKWSREL